MVKSDFSSEKGVLGKKQESKFREMFKDISCYVFRIPDYALTGLRIKAPADFLVVRRGRSWMFEVKHTKSLTSLSYDNITEHQLISLRQHREKGKGRSYLVVFNPNGIWFVDVKDILSFMYTSKRKSIPFKYIVEKGLDRNEFIQFFKYIYAG